MHIISRTTWFPGLLDGSCLLCAQSFYPNKCNPLSMAVTLARCVWSTNHLESARSNTAWCHVPTLLPPASAVVDGSCCRLPTVLAWDYCFLCQQAPWQQGLGSRGLENCCCSDSFVFCNANNVPCPECCLLTISPRRLPTVCVCCCNFPTVELQRIFRSNRNASHNVSCQQHTQLNTQTETDGQWLRQLDNGCNALPPHQARHQMKV